MAPDSGCADGCTECSCSCIECTPPRKNNDLFNILLQNSDIPKKAAEPQKTSRDLKGLKAGFFNKKPTPTPVPVSAKETKVEKKEEDKEKQVPQKEERPPDRREQKPRKLVDLVPENAICEPLVPVVKKAPPEPLKPHHCEKCSLDVENKIVLETNSCYKMKCSKGCEVHMHSQCFDTHVKKGKKKKELAGHLCIRDGCAGSICEFLKREAGQTGDFAMFFKVKSVEIETKIDVKPKKEKKQKEEKKETKNVVREHRMSYRENKENGESTHETDPSPPSTKESTPAPAPPPSPPPVVRLLPTTQPKLTRHLPAETKAVPLVKKEETVETKYTKNAEAKTPKRRAKKVREVVMLNVPITMPGQHATDEYDEDEWRGTQELEQFPLQPSQEQLELLDDIREYFGQLNEDQQERKTVLLLNIPYKGSLSELAEAICNFLDLESFEDNVEFNLKPKFQQIFEEGGFLLEGLLDLLDFRLEETENGCFYLRKNETEPFEFPALSIQPESKAVSTPMPASVQPEPKLVSAAIPACIQPVSKPISASVPAPPTFAPAPTTRSQPKTANEVNRSKILDAMRLVDRNREGSPRRTISLSPDAPPFVPSYPGFPVPPSEPLMYPPACGMRPLPAAYPPPPLYGREEPVEMTPYGTYSRFDGSMGDQRPPSSRNNSYSPTESPSWQPHSQSESTNGDVIQTQSGSKSDQKSGSTSQSRSHQKSGSTSESRSESKCESKNEAKGELWSRPRNELKGAPKAYQIEPDPPTDDSQTRSSSCEKVVRRGSDDRSSTPGTSSDLQAQLELLREESARWKARTERSLTLLGEQKTQCQELKQKNSRLEKELKEKEEHFEQERAKHLEMAYRAHTANQLDTAYEQGYRLGRMERCARSAIAHCDRIILSPIPDDLKGNFEELRRRWDEWLREVKIAQRETQKGNPMELGPAPSFPITALPLLQQAVAHQLDKYKKHIYEYAKEVNVILTAEGRTLPLDKMYVMLYDYLCGVTTKPNVRDALEFVCDSMGIDRIAYVPRNPWNIDNSNKERRIPVVGHECKICYDVIPAEVQARTCPNKECAEPYHIKCIEDWVRKNPNCPNCRKKFLSADEFPDL